MLRGVILLAVTLLFSSAVGVASTATVENGILRVTATSRSISLNCSTSSRRVVLDSALLSIDGAPVNCSQITEIQAALDSRGGFFRFYFRPSHWKRLARVTVDGSPERDVFRILQYSTSGPVSPLALTINPSTGSDRVYISTTTSDENIWAEGDVITSMPRSASGKGMVIAIGAPDKLYLMSRGGDDVVNLSRLSQSITTYINASTGNDYVEGSPSSDQILGGTGDDVLLGLGGNDRLSGGSGNDKLYGGEGDDRLRGNSGNDLLVGGAGTDNLDGGGGRDRILGEGGRDRLRGSVGNDKLVGGPDKDRLDGGPGNDSCLSGEKLTGCEM